MYSPHSGRFGIVFPSEKETEILSKEPEHFKTRAE